MADQAIDLAPDYRVRLIGTLPVLTVWQRPWRDVSGMLKRTEDVILALLALKLPAALTAGGNSPGVAVRPSAVVEDLSVGEEQRVADALDRLAHGGDAGAGGDHQYDAARLT